MEDKILLTSWIEADADCLTNWQCWMQTYGVLWIRNSENANVSNFVQDIFLWATMFVWVVVTISFVISGFMLVSSAGNESLAEKGKSWLKYSIIWLLLVVFSYSIVRIVQTISAW